MTLGHHLNMSPSKSGKATALNPFNSLLIRICVYSILVSCRVLNSWLDKVELPPSGSLIQLITKDGQTTKVISK